jgi:hypothetical protein
MPEETEQERYIRFQEKFKAELGDHVKILCEAHDGEAGWQNIWTGTITRTVGHTGIILGSSKTGGIKVEVPVIKDYFYYPYFVLQIMR